MGKVAAARGRGGGRGGQRPPNFLLLPDPPFPSEHDEAAASVAVSQGGPGCDCWVCQTVMLPRLREWAEREEADDAEEGGVDGEGDD